MLKAVLLDLDDTLLANDMNVFLPHYIRLLHERGNPCPNPARFTAALRAGTRAMLESNSGERNEDVFWNAFEPLAGCTRERALPVLEQFYRTTYPKLMALTRTVPFARELVFDLMERGLLVVIATNPVFPRLAIEERLRWANIGLDEVPYALVTTYENMNATKPHVSYYEQILRRLGVTADEAWMIGNSLDADIEPARRAGLKTVLVQNASGAPFEGREREAAKDIAKALAKPAPEGSLRWVWQTLREELA